MRNSTSKYLWLSILVLLAIAGWYLVNRARKPDEDWAAQQKQYRTLFPDRSLRSSVMEAIREQQNQDARLSEERLLELTALDVRYLGTSRTARIDLAGIEKLANLRELTITCSVIEHASNLGKLTSLEELQVYGNPAPLLCEVCGPNDPLQDHRLEPLGSLKNLQRLDLNLADAGDLAPLGSLRDLQSLRMTVNDPGFRTDLSPLARLTNLRSLRLNLRSDDDLTPLSELGQLQELALFQSGNLTDISPLSKLTNLKVLELSENQLSDITPLGNLSNLQVLFLDRNQIEDIDVLRELTHLQWLSLDENRVSDIGSLANLSDLRVLRLGKNRIDDISPILGLTKLGQREPSWQNRTRLSRGVSILLTAYDASIDLSHNQIQAIDPLVDNRGIEAGVVVDLRGNPLNDESYDVHIPALQKRGAEVMAGSKSGELDAPTFGR